MYFFLHRKQREFWWSQPYQPHNNLRSTICECADTSNPACASRERQLPLPQGWLPAQQRIFKCPHTPDSLLAAIWNPTIDIHSFGFRRVFSLWKCKCSCDRSLAWSPLRCLQLVHTLYTYRQARLQNGTACVPLMSKHGTELLFNECSLFTSQCFRWRWRNGQQRDSWWRMLVNDLLP